MRVDPTPDVAVRLPVPQLAPWRAGNVGIEGVWRFAADEAGPHLLVTALIHGNEIAGAVLLTRWLEAGLRPRRGTLTLCFANLPAFDRFDPADPTATRFLDADMNRIWAPELLGGPRSSAELDRARALLPVVLACDVLLDLHSMLWPSDPLFIAGPGTRARELALALGTPPLVICDQGHASGMRLIDHAHFDSAATAVLLEAGQHWEPATLSQMERTAAVVLGRLGMADAVGPGAAAPPGRAAWVTRTVTAQTDDFAFARTFRGGEVVPARDTLIAMDGETEIRTPHDDCLLVMPSPRVMRGHTAVRLARFEE
jgi:succinylglutamate desuccinylase